MRNLFWNIIAFIVSFTTIRNRLLKRAFKTPYIHLPGYMDRYWLFNPYQYDNGDYIKHGWLRRLLPSIRVHHILRADNAEHMHDHPWDARTILLIGGYTEDYLNENGQVVRAQRIPGDTRAIRFGEYHHIAHVTTGGVWTLFFTWKYRGTWGFLVDGEKMQHLDYKKVYDRV